MKQPQESTPISQFWVGLLRRYEAGTKIVVFFPAETDNTGPYKTSLLLKVPLDGEVLGCAPTDSRQITLKSPFALSILSAPFKLFKKA